MSNDDLELTRFVENLQQEVIINAEGNQTEEEGGSFREEAFTRLMIEYLTEAGELEDGYVCYHSARSIKINGYNIHEDEGRLDLFISIYTQNSSPTTVRKDAVESAFKQLINFLSVRTRAVGISQRLNKSGRVVSVRKRSNLCRGLVESD